MTLINPEIEINPMDAVTHFCGVVDDLYDDVKARFPDEPITHSQLATFFNASKAGHMRRFLAVLNELQNEELINYLVNVKFDEIDGQSFTPLTNGALMGNVMFVWTLLDRYNVDMESECNIVFDGMVVYGATALWLAGAMGHLQIVKLLVKHGASVNHNTKAQSSPLRAACYEGRLDIVKYLIAHGADVNLANTYNNTCIMIAAYRGHTDVVRALLKYGAQPNDQALCGATALHYAAETKHLDVCRLLLDHGARLLLNEYNLTAVLHAADRTHEDIVDLFISRPELMTKEEIITALELLGASFANDKDNYSLEKAYTYLLRAMEMRFEDPNNIIRKRLIAPVPAYDNWFETENLAELNAIRLNHHSMHMESLTIRERILGKNYPDLAQAIVYRGAVMADQGRFSQCQTLWSYAIDLRMINNVSVERDLLRFAQLFSQILRIPTQSIELPMVLSILRKCQQEIMNNKYKIHNPGPKDTPRLLRDQNDQNIVTALYIIKIVTIIIGRMPKEELPTEHFRNVYVTLTKLIRCDTRLADGQSLLHMSVNGVTQVDDFHTNEICKFPCYRTALLLVKFGASLHVADMERNTPLHTLLATYPRSEDPRFLRNAEDTVKLFCQSGAHLDAVNAQGQTPGQIYNSSTTLSNMLVGFQNNRISLKCLASRCIAFHRLPYVGHIPKALESFVQMHSAEKPEAAA